MTDLQDRKLRIYNQERRRRNRNKARRKKELRKNILIILIMLVSFSTISSLLLKNSKKNVSDAGSVSKRDKVNKEILEETTSEIAYSIGVPERRTKEEVINKLRKFAKKDVRMEYIYKNRMKYSEDMLSALVNTPEMIEFVRGYLDAQPKAMGGFTKTEKKEKYPLFNQWDTRWAYTSYGDSNIGIAGCGPTCLSMVIFSLTRNEDATPDKIADFSQENGYYVDGVGTSWKLMTDLGNKYGVSSYTISLSETTMKMEIEKGHMLICAVGPGDFTTAGHFIVIYGYDKNGFRVNDPNSVARSSRRYSFKQLVGEIKSLWAYSI